MAQGIFAAWEAVVLIHRLVQAKQIPCPLRSIRAVLWVDEEVSQRGAATYLEQHVHELPQHVIAMESDIGNFVPYAFGFTGLPEAKQVMQGLATLLLANIHMGNITDDGPSHCRSRSAA